MVSVLGGVYVLFPCYLLLVQSFDFDANMES